VIGRNFSKLEPEMSFWETQVILGPAKELPRSPRTPAGLTAALWQDGDRPFVAAFVDDELVSTAEGDAAAEFLAQWTRGERKPPENKGGVAPR
jgi:hypothetical protein